MLANMSILDHNSLVFQQTKNFSKNDFAIFDAQGNQIAHVETGGSTLGRMFAGARELNLFDGPGRPLLQVKDQANIGRDKMDIFDPHGQQIGRLVKRFAFFKTRITIEVLGEELELDGNPFGFNFQILGPQGQMGVVAREWSGGMNALTGKSTYSLDLAEWTNHSQRMAIIGGVLALDLIREKQERNS